ncbi:MAG TPA: tRNA (adenosine(37)-N6)-threonylcarbamoyltransferase complex dimerization subunit type 1 TsaB [Stellaceae bacterium]|nr:tRNA (adenosine(37)-N6)-threonylcarbamoyltransferase complex dimerization subunit type 1 TsaB [Stellaceae bacterium]
MPASSAPGADRRAPVVLAFDTAASACSVAVGRGATVIARERREMRHGHGEALFPMIERTMATAEFVPADIDIVAVSVGPGGFTGIRAGLAAARGLALAADARLVGVTSFAAVAALMPKRATALLVALDSRREDFYVQIFDAEGHPCGEPATILPDDLGRFVNSAIRDMPLCIAGDAAEGAANALGARDGITTAANSAPDAAGVLTATMVGGKTPDARTRPLYLRPADVSFPKGRRGIIAP